MDQGLGKATLLEPFRDSFDGSHAPPNYSTPISTYSPQQPHPKITSAESDTVILEQNSQTSVFSFSTEHFIFVTQFCSSSWSL